MDQHTLSQEFGYRVKRRRMALGLLQKTLADRTGVPQGQISRLESGGVVAINLDRLVNLADALSTSVDYLLGRVDDPGEVTELLQCAAVV